MIIMSVRDKVIISALVFFGACLLLFFVSNRAVHNTLVCKRESNDIVLSNNIEKYTFKGINGNVESEDLEVNIYSDSQSLIEDYERVIRNNEECSNINVGDKYISYKCHYDIEKSSHYKELKNKDGNIPIDAIKERFELDNFICEYK